MMKTSEMRILLLVLLLLGQEAYCQDDDMITPFDEVFIFLPTAEDEFATEPVHFPVSANTSNVVSFTSLTGKDTDGRFAVKYYDGFGRLKEEVKVDETTAHNDLVIFHEYDAHGRKAREWLPTSVTPSSPGQYTPFSGFSAAAAGMWNDTHPFTACEYEPMPGGAVTSTTGPGEVWHALGKAVRYEYLTNVSGNDTLNCLQYNTSNSGNTLPHVSISGSHVAGSLLVTRKEDEDGHAVLVFKDRMGRILLSRSIDHAGASKILYDTYYVYDGEGNLVAVIPPSLSDKYTSGTLDAADIKDYAYIYGYDRRRRRCYSKLPGVEPVLTVYDGADRPMYVQTGGQRRRGESTFHIYDIFGRECITGICSYNIPIQADPPFISTMPYCTYTGLSDEFMGYEIQGISLSAPKLLKVSYYDRYDFLSGNDSLMYTWKEGYGKKLNKAYGLLTGTVSACLSSNDMKVPYLHEAIYYDDRQRIIQTKSTNHLSGTDAHYYAYNFIGQETAHLHVHTSKIQPRLSTTTVETSNTYDHAGRLLTVTHSVNGGTPVTIRNLTYDELGHVRSDSRNGGQGLLQSYEYNARSWTTGITGSLFNMSVCYGMDHDGQGTAFNGNMASVEWSSLNDVTRRYSFRYDGLSRLSGAIYTEENNENNDRYSTSYSYDKQGNIESLSRNGLQDDGTYGKVDDLFYEYDGNRLVKVSNAVDIPCYKGAMHFADGADEETEYLYDDDGNMVCDKNRGISDITYNIILKPEHIQFNTGRYMNFAYSATGEKLQANYMLELPRLHEPGIRTLSSGQSGFGNSLGGLDDPVGPGIRDSLIGKDRPQLGDNLYILIYGAHRTDYCGNVIYEDLCLIPDRILFDGGYVTFSNKQPVYHFYLTDHQGNVRVVASADGTLEETNHYYPFGALFGESAGSSRQRYKYNGKELERLLALDWYDYGARWYDPVLARWHAVDPLAEKYPDISPYVYCNNNAVNAIDPDGRKIVIVGDRQQRISVLGQLQKLTNDKLGVRRSDGMVIILSRGTRNRDKKLVNGTRLVSELINHERSMDIRPSADNSREHDRYQMDALNGKGTDVSIYYNMRQNPTVLTRNPKTGKIKEEAIPSHIVLGHELIHGHRSMNGKAVYWENRSDYTYKTENGNIMKTEAETEELETVGIRGNYTHTENKLRKEQDLNKRIEY